MPKCRTQGVLVFANFDDPPGDLGSVKPIAEQVHLLCGILYHRFRFPATFASTFHRRTCSVLTARFIQAIHLCKHHKTICQVEWTCHAYSIRSCSSSIRRSHTSNKSHSSLPPNRQELHGILCNITYDAAQVLGTSMCLLQTKHWAVIIENTHSPSANNVGNISFDSQSSLACPG